MKISRLTVITGQIGAGKSTVTDFLRERRLTVLDADIMAGIAVNENRHAIAEVLGDTSIASMGSIERRAAIAQIIFTDPDKKKELEKFVFPIVHSMFLSARMMFEQLGNEFLFYDAPLIFESGFLKDLAPDHVIIIDANVDIRRKRVMERRGYTAEEFDRRNKAQLTIAEKLAIWPDSIVVDNSGTMDDLVQKVKPALVKVFF